MFPDNYYKHQPISFPPILFHYIFALLINKHVPATCDLSQATQSFMACSLHSSVVLAFIDFNDLTFNSVLLEMGAGSSFKNSFVEYKLYSNNLTRKLYMV